MVDFMTGLTGVKAALDGAKEIRSAYDKLSDLKKDIDSVEEQRLMLGLDKQILELEKALHGLDRENHELKVRLQEKQSFEGMGFDEGFGTKTKTNESGKVEHFCTSCLGKSGALIQMRLQKFAGGPGYNCPACSHTYLGRH